MVAEKLTNWMRMIAENKTKPKLKTASVRAGEPQTAHRHVLRGLMAAGLLEKTKAKKGKNVIVEYAPNNEGRALMALLDGHQTQLPAPTPTTTPAATPEAPRSRRPRTPRSADARSPETVVAPPTPQPTQDTGTDGQQNA